MPDTVYEHYPATEDEPGGRGRPPKWAVLVAVTGAPVAWSLHLGVAYILVAWHCTTGWPWILPALMATNLVAVALAVASGVVAYRWWRRAGGATGMDTWTRAMSEPLRPAPFFWLIGVLLAVIFTVVILFASVPPFVLPMCPPSPASVR